MKEAFERSIERLDAEVKYQNAKADEDCAFEKVSVFKARTKMAECYEHAIEIVNQVAEEYKDRDCSKCSRRSWYQIGYADAEKKYGNGWIPVEERLPEEDRKMYVVELTNGVIDVLGFAKDAYKLDRYDFVEYKGKKKPIFYDFDSEYGYIEMDCVAWMPLPEPYVPKGE